MPALLPTGYLPSVVPVNGMAEVSESARVLLLLSAAGSSVPLPELSRATAWGQPITQQTAQLLEQRGLARRSGENWEPAHDEIADLSLSLAEPLARRQAHEVLGRALAETAGDSRTSLARAGRHLVEAERWEELRSVFLRYIRRMRTDGDGRRLRFLALDFLEGMPHEIVTRLLRELGRWNILRYDIARPMVTAITLVVVLGCVLAVAVGRRPGPDIILALRPLSGSASEELLEFPMRRSDWVDQGPIQLDDARRVPVPGQLSTGHALIPSPDGSEWNMTINVGNTMGTDIARVDVANRKSVLVGGPRDQDVSAWLPDASGIVLTSAEWSAIGADEYDIAVLPIGGTRRRLTATPDHDGSPYPSPEGTRIAFMRAPRQRERPPQVCLIPFDGSRLPVCHDTDRSSGTSLTGWIDPDHLLLVERDVEGLNRLVLFDLRSSLRTSIVTDVIRATLSADGRWLGYLALPPGRQTSSWFVAPIQTLDQPREIVLGGDAASYEIIWRPSMLSRTYLDRLLLLRHEEALPSHAAYRLQTSALDARGHALDYRLELQYGSTDSSIATVDSTGLVRPHGAGTVRLWVSANGWRADTMSLTFAAESYRPVLHEYWDIDLATRWVAYGSPRPMLVDGGNGHRAFWNHGDGSYPSGAYTRQSWPAEAGLGIEADVAVPVTRIQWQMLQMSLVGGLDSTLIGEADHRIGALPTAPFSSRLCGASLPAGEGQEAMNRISFGAGEVNYSIPVDPTILRGRWTRVRIQLFPDGTCGVALDGRPVWHSRLAIPLDRPFAILLGANSAGTRILHGELSAWTGVRDDIDW